MGIPGINIPGLDGGQPPVEQKAPPVEPVGERAPHYVAMGPFGLFEIEAKYIPEAGFPSVIEVVLAMVVIFCVLKCVRYLRLALVHRLRVLAEAEAEEQEHEESNLRLGRENTRSKNVFKQFEHYLLTVMIVFFPSAAPDWVSDRASDTGSSSLNATNLGNLPAFRRGSSKLDQPDRSGSEEANARMSGNLKRAFSSRRNSFLDAYCIEQIVKESKHEDESADISMWSFYGVLDLGLSFCITLHVMWKKRLPSFILNQLRLVLGTLCIIRFSFPLLALARNMSDQLQSSVVTSQSVKLQAKFLQASLRVVAHFVIGALILHVWGFDTTSITTGLGISGLALGLAVQATLKDLFASFVLLFDSPFSQGDFVNVGKGYAWAPSGGYDGVVEEIGLRCTRIRLNMYGQVLHIPNSDLASTRIVNQSQMTERKHEMVLTVDYQTPMKKLEMMEEYFEEAVEDVDNVRFSMCYLAGLMHVGFANANGIKFVAKYFVQGFDTPEYQTAMGEINFNMLRILEREQITLSCWDGKIPVESMVDRNVAYANRSMAVPGPATNSIGPFGRMFDLTPRPTPDATPAQQNSSDEEQAGRRTGQRRTLSGEPLPSGLNINVPLPSDSSSELEQEKTDKSNPSSKNLLSTGNNLLSPEFSSPPKMRLTPGSVKSAGSSNASPTNPGPGKSLVQRPGAAEIISIESKESR